MTRADRHCQVGEKNGMNLKCQGQPSKFRDRRGRIDHSGVKFAGLGHV